MNSKLKKEAEAFDKRIDERAENGFVPDLQKLKHNPYFYKSFWRDPHYANLYIGDICNDFLTNLQLHCPPKSKVLDFGCGQGYLALEIARQGYEVVGIDISSSSIAAAKKALKASIKQNTFGSLEYHVGEISDFNFTAQFDAVICSGVLHHMEYLPDCLQQIYTALKSRGILLWHEPQHKYWTKTDASIVVLIRLLLANLNMWYDENLKNVQTTEQLMQMISDTMYEFNHERDPSENEGQSPNDLSQDRDIIVSEIKKKFEILDLRQSFSFIYRLLGGMRGKQEILNNIASILQLFDKSLSAKGILNSNYFYGKAIKN